MTKDNIPFFSVVIPVYNKGPHIQRSLSSVFNQTFKDFELILINDASTDNSLEEIKKFSDPRIRLFHRNQPGPGGYAARNLGIKKANTHWIAFLDADDEWDNQHLENVFNGINNYPQVDLVSCGYRISKGDERDSFDNYYKQKAKLGAHTYNINTYISGPKPIWTSVAVIKKALLIESEGFNTTWRHGGDVELWLRLLLFYEAKGLWLPHLGAVYYLNSVNMVTDNLSQVYSPSSVTINKYISAKDELDASFVKKLKKFANRPVNTLIRRKIKNDKMSFKYLKEVAFLDLIPLHKRLIYSFLALCPLRIQRFFKTFL